MAIKNWPAGLENALIYSRNTLLILLIVALFPHYLIVDFLSKTESATTYFYIYCFLAAAFCLGYLILSIFKLYRSAFRDIRAAEAPQSRNRPNRWLWFDSLTLFIILLGIIFIELWFLSILGQNQFLWRPETIFILPTGQETDVVFEMKKMAWWCCATLTALVFFLWGCLGNRLMSTILIPVTFHERDVRGIIQNAYKYLRHFALALLLNKPVLVPGGLVLTFIFLFTPIVFVSVDQYQMLDTLTEADQIILAIGVFFAWFSNLVISAINPDVTFADYFNKRLSTQLMMVQGHIVFLGFGSLGQRVVEREVNQMLSGKNGDYFLEVVTPDIRIEMLSSHAVIVERRRDELIYAGENQTLGEYGVASTHRRIYKSRDPRGNIIHPESRILVPMVIGEANEASMPSRVNLERSRLIISMVPDEESVQAVFEQADRTNISTIMSVSRSDQISYLTYRARHRRIVLVYPKHNQGKTLGHKLWTAILKVRSLEKMPKNQWPRILIVGNNKANHYMVEHIWNSLPGSFEKKSALVQENIAFLAVAPDERIGYPVLKDKDNKDTFDLAWPQTFVTGGRFPDEADDVPEIDTINSPTRVVNQADSISIEACIREHQPQILVIDHDEIEHSSLLLARCVRALERLKTRQPSKFRLPLILLSTSLGDERERLILGDASRYYDALCKMHNELVALDTSYPAHARYDHYTSELVGETITDSLSDAEEIIAGARRTLSRAENSGINPQKLPHHEKQFVEISSCFPNRPGALANYMARLSGIDFVPPTMDLLEQLWQASAKDIRVPSFRHLRNITLDPAGNGFALSGYASLVPVRKDSPIFEAVAEETSRIVRTYVNDGRKHREKELDIAEMYGRSELEALQRRLDTHEKPQPPGVPEVLDRLTRRKCGEDSTITEFQQVMMDPDENGVSGKYACPGMTHCRISAYQDFVAGANNLRLNPQINRTGDSRLWHSQNYQCCSSMTQAKTEELPTPSSPYARIFCCGSNATHPGQISQVLNQLVFRGQPTYCSPSGDESDDWVLNVDYFQDASCQNSYFTLNRLFGFFQKKRPMKHQSDVPRHEIRLIRILPIGNLDAFREWYEYSRALCQFMNRETSEPLYQFYWMDEKRKRHDDLADQPSFNKEDRSSFPIVLVIKRREAVDTDLYYDLNRCRVCGVQDAENDCSNLRAWV